MMLALAHFSRCKTITCDNKIELQVKRGIQRTFKFNGRDVGVVRG
jgi:hypothetical protein